MDGNATAKLVHQSRSSVDYAVHLPHFLDTPRLFLLNCGRPFIFRSRLRMNAAAYRLYDEHHITEAHKSGDDYLPALINAAAPILLSPLLLGHFISKS